jgi:hypothetical protein
MSRMSSPESSSSSVPIRARFPHPRGGTRRLARPARAAIAVACAGAAALAAGCASSGLSTRETVGRDYASYAYAMYQSPDDAPGKGRPSAPAEVLTPARVAVAQLGEVAPPEQMLARLRADKALFARVEPVPGIMYAAPNARGFQRNPAAAPSDYAPVADPYEQARQHAEAMRRYARDTGADYLFLFGGTIDHNTTGTPLSLMDLTIVGAFVVPSRKTDAAARATGSLIDVETGRVVASVSADESRGKLSTSVSADANEEKLLYRLRQEVAIDLAEQLCTQLQARGGVSVPNGSDTTRVGQAGAQGG